MPPLGRHSILHSMPDLEEELLSQGGDALTKVGSLRKKTAEYIRIKKAEIDKIVEEFERLEKLGKSGDRKQEICDEFAFAMGMPVENKSGWLLHTWFTLCRIRFAFFIIVSFAILLSLFTGCLMETFFVVLGAHDAEMNSFNWFKWHLVFWFLPYEMMIFALFGDEMCDLILDCLHCPALNEFQAVLIVVLPRQKGEQNLCPHPKQVRIVDWMTFFLLEILPLTIAFSSLYLMSDFSVLSSVAKMLFMGYVQGSLLSAVLTTVIFMLCDMLMTSGLRDSFIGERALWKQWVSQTIQRRKMHPYMLHKHFRKLHKILDSEVDASPESLTRRLSEALSETSPESLDSEVGARSRQDNKSQKRQGKKRTLSTIAVWTVAAFVFEHFETNPDRWWVPVMVGVMVVLNVTVCSWYLRQCFPSLTGTPYVLILTFFVLVCASLNSTAASRVTSHGGLKEIMTVVAAGAAPDGGNRSLPMLWRPVRSRLPETQCSLETGQCQHESRRAQPYPLCDMSWGSPGAPVRALDLANLAWIVYDPAPLPPDLAESRIAGLLNRSFRAERRARVLGVNGYDRLPRWAHFYFPPAGEGARATHVVAVKGTSTVRDALVDTNLFATVQVLQTVQQVLPVLTVLPRPVIQWMLQNIRLHSARRAEREIIQTLLDDVSGMITEYPEDFFVLTGHSLGGGLAQIVAAKLALPAVVWSAPGSVYSAKRFGIEVQALKQNVVSVMPDHDVVPRVDLQGGMLQLIECRLKDGEEGNALTCHSLRKSACEVWRVCGDSRDFSSTCNDFVDRRDLGRLFHDDDSTS